MNLFEAKLLLTNLLNRIQTNAEGDNRLPGIVTASELEALQFALSRLGSGAGPSGVTEAELPSVNEESQTLEEAGGQDSSVDTGKNKLNASALSLPPAPGHYRVCLDFGTATSKATLVIDGDEGETEKIHVLDIGVPGDQEEISETMLVSSVYVDNSGMLWFGKAAVDRSMLESSDGTRQRLDNIKRRLSEEGWDERVGENFNPTDVPVTYGDMVLAYLTFMTWTVRDRLEVLGLPRNTLRRFAIPCLHGAQGREALDRLRSAIGTAQVIADTFDSRLVEGIEIQEFMEAISLAKKHPEVGAGTSDLSLYRIGIDPKKHSNSAFEVEGSSRGITEAGNYLDRALMELILSKSGIDSHHPMWRNIRGALELQIRDYKETLFNDEAVVVPLISGDDVEVELEEFLSLSAVSGFGESLRNAIVDILENVDSSFVDWVLANEARRLGVVLTGGGAQLPMVKELAAKPISIRGRKLPVVAVPFPEWLGEIDENLEEIYPRIAVSLGGARSQLIKQGGIISSTGGDVTAPPTLGGFYTKGN